MNTPNLFSIATSELSQDAFITWLMEWANPELEEANLALHQAGNQLVRKLIHHQFPSVGSITKVKAGRQWEGIDIWAEVNDSYLIIIEDKVGTGRHSDQLARYKKSAQEWCGANSYQLVCVYLKTRSECLATAREVQAEGYSVVSRTDLLSILENHKVDNDIYKDFTNHLRLLEGQESRFACTNWAKWNTSEWIGLYRTLDQAGIIKEWSYVPNQTGGFWNAVLPGSDHDGYPVYAQIEQGSLCFKVGEVQENRGHVRNQLHDLLRSRATEELPIDRPNRFGSGTYMTVASVSADKWIKATDGIISIQQTIETLKAYQAWLQNVIENQRTIESLPTHA
jgi:hypothetical protein